MTKGPEQYQPPEEEVKKAEEMMTEGQEETSKERESDKEIDDRIVESDETDEQGNRNITYECGCEASSGGGAYGTRGSAWILNACSKHQDSGYYR